MSKIKKDEVPSTKGADFKGDIERKVRKEPDPTKPPAFYEMGDLFTKFLSEEGFWGHFLTRVVRVKDWGQLTAYVTLMKNKRGVVMGYNPSFLAEYMTTQNESYSAKSPVGDFMYRTYDLQSFVIRHEFAHVLLRHLGPRKITGKWSRIGNIAMDLAINSLLTDGGNFPPGFLVPGKPWLTKQEMNSNPPPSKEHVELSNFIATLPRLQTTEFYFHELQKFLNENNRNPEDPIYEIGFDNHDLMDGIELSEDDQAALDREIGDVLRGAVNNAKRTQKWGSVPNDVVPLLLEMAGQGEVNWKHYVSYFLKRAFSLHRETTMTRMNKKLPWKLPGQKKDLVARLLIVLDQSGSMPDEDCAKAFSEVMGAAKNFEVHTVNADVDLDMTSFQVLDWKRSKVVPKRTKCGGTDMNCAIRWLNEERKNYYTGVVFISDGYTGKREPLYGITKVLWIITPNGTAEAAMSEDIVVQMNDRQ